jgi:hypothetical protein
MGSFATINKTQSGNFWELNPHIIYVDPFKDLYNSDKSTNKEQSSKDMWCILWLTDPDEEVNKYYRIADKDERMSICKSFNPNFDPDHPQIIDCLEKYPYLCMNADELAYKLQKDQLIEISQFLSKQEITMDSIGDIIKHKAAMPKIYQDFEKIEKMFQKNKSEQRVWGNRKLTARERGSILPDK